MTSFNFAAWASLSKLYRVAQAPAAFRIRMRARAKPQYYGVVYEQTPNTETIQGIADGNAALMHVVCVGKPDHETNS